MKRLYRLILLFLERVIIFLEVTKTCIGENYGLLRKHNLYKDIKWSKKRNQEFNKFWKENYGRKITSRGHKLYEAINNKHHKDYMPDFIFATKIEPLLNPYFYCKIYEDKSITELLYAKKSIVKFPETYLVNSGGILYDGERNVITKERAQLILHSLTEAVIKPTIDGNSGKGVIVCTFKDGYDQNKNFNVLELLEKGRRDFIVQEKMKQHKSIADIYSNSINTFRTITYVVSGIIYCADLALRIGSGGGDIDNIHAGGMGIGAKDDGTLLKYAYKLGNKNSREKFEIHPDSGIIFDNYKVYGTEKIIECAKELHGLTPHIGMISWDFMVSESGEPVLIEINLRGQAVWLTQIVHGKPFFGDQTKDILALIK